eukprot:6465804-Amphidinium_carterae.3
MGYSNISPEYYYNLVDEDNGQSLDAQQVADGVRQEMKFLDEQRLGEPYLRREVPEGSGLDCQMGTSYQRRRCPIRITAIQACHYRGGQRSVRRNTKVRKHQDTDSMAHWALMYGHEIRTGDFSVAFMFTPVPDDVLIFVEAPAEAGP